MIVEERQINLWVSKLITSDALLDLRPVLYCKDIAHTLHQASALS